MTLPVECWNAPSECVNLCHSYCRCFWRICNKNHPLQWERQLLVPIGRAPESVTVVCCCLLTSVTALGDCCRHNSCSHFYICVSVDTCCRIERWSVTARWRAGLSRIPQQLQYSDNEFIFSFQNMFVLEQTWHLWPYIINIYLLCFDWDSHIQLQVKVCEPFSIMGISLM